MTHDRKAFEVDCKFGPHRVMMTPQPENKWKPFNLDGTPHNCRDQKNIEKQKPQQGQTAFLSDAMDLAVRKIAREEIEKWYAGASAE